MNDFLLTYQPPRPVISSIECDSDGCTQRVTVSQDIDEAQAALVVRAIGWTAQMGAHRWSHHCPRHSETKR